MSSAAPRNTRGPRLGWRRRGRLALAAAAGSTGGRLAILGAAVVVVWLVTAAIAALADAHSSYGMALWSGLRHLFDPGSLGDDETTAQRIVGVTQVFTGLIFLAGVAFTVLADGVERGLRRLSEDAPPVTESGHVLVIGRGPVRDAVLDALAALEPEPGERRPAVVALAPTRDDMPPKTGRPYRLLARTGDPGDASALDAAGAAAARGIVIAGGRATDRDVADLETLETCAALADHLDRAGAAPLVAVHVERASNADSVWPLLPDTFDAVPGDRNIGTILALGVALPEYPSVLDAPTGPDGAVPFVVAAGDLAGTRFGDALGRCPQAVPLGLLRGDRAEYAPAPDTLIEAADGLIVLAPDRAAAQRRGPRASAGEADASALALEPVAPGVRRVLVLGWSAAGADLAREIPDPGVLTVLALLDDAPAGLPAARLRPGDPNEHAAIEAAVAGVDPDIVVLLAGANGGADPMACHARAALAALHVSRVTERPVPIVVEQHSSAHARRLRLADPRIRAISRAEMAARSLVLSSTDRDRTTAQEALVLDPRLSPHAVRHAGDRPVSFVAAHRALLDRRAVPLVMTRDGEELDLNDPAAATIRPGDGLLLLRRSA